MAGKRVPYTTRGTENVELHVPIGEGWTSSLSSDESMKDLAKELPKIPEKVNFTRSDVSVPSPWATFLAFDVMLTDGEKSFGDLSSTATREWRCLMTILALRDIYGLKLDRDIIDITDKKYENEDKDFFGNLLALAPQKHVFRSRECWNKMVFLTLEGFPIGAFSNSTLICSLNKYEEGVATKKLKELGFMNEDLQFVDPVDILEKDLSLSLYVCLWLQTVKKSIPVAGGSGIGRIIDAFEEEIEERCHGDKDLYKNLKENGYIETEYASEKDEPENASELLWNVRISKMNLALPCILEAIKVSKITTAVYILQALGNNIMALKELLGDKCIAPEGEAFWDNEYIFLDKMSLVEIGSNSNDEKAYEDFLGECILKEKKENGEVEEKRYSYILPLNEELFKHLSAEELRNSVEVNGDYDEEIAVTLRLELKSGHMCILSKTYKKEDCEKLYNIDLPTVAVWPYAIVKKEEKNVWKDYYVFTAREECDTTYEIKVRSGKSLEELDYTELDRNRRPGDLVRRVARSKELPSYMAIYKNEFDLSRRNIIKQEKLGIIILPQPKEYKLSDNKKYRVGFDFGTTSTTAFCSRLEDASEDYRYFIKLGKFTESAGAESRKTDVKADFEKNQYVGDDESGCVIIYKNGGISNKQEPQLSFVPQDFPKNKSYVSLFKKNSDENVDEIESLKLGNAIFDQKLSSHIEERDLVRNLKWSSNYDRMRARTGYLSQIMKQIVFALAKEGISEIFWDFSYPTALPKKEVINYKDVTERIVKGITEVTGIDSKVDKYYPESIASAKFLGKRYKEDFICIDIGGGSTDVSAWKKTLNSTLPPINVMQFSIGIASRKIFLAGITDIIVDPKTIHEDPNGYRDERLQNKVKELLNKKFSDNANMSERFESVRNKIREETKLENKNVFEAMNEFSYVVESLLQTHGEELKDAVKSAPDEIVEKFEKFLVFGFWGILYYCGKSLGKYKDVLKESKRIEVDMAGQGSLLYKWLQKRYEDGLKSAFEKVLKESLGHDAKVSFNCYDKDLKTEAAIGLIMLRDEDNKEEILKNTSLISGAKCKVVYQSKASINLDVDADIDYDAWSEYFGKDANCDVQEIILDNPAEALEEYITIMNEEVYKKSDLRPAFVLSAEYKDGIEKNIGTVISANIDSATIAPPFIIVLEALLRTILGY